MKFHLFFLQQQQTQTTYASKRVIWTKYLFQYRRTEMRRTILPILRKWSAYTQRNIAKRLGRRSLTGFNNEINFESDEDLSENKKNDNEKSSNDGMNGEGEGEEEDVKVPLEDPNVVDARRWSVRLQQAAACLRGLQEGAVPEDRLDERAMRDMLVQIDDTRKKRKKKIRKKRNKRKKRNVKKNKKNNHHVLNPEDMENNEELSTEEEDSMEDEEGDDAAELSTEEEENSADSAEEDEQEEVSIQSERERASRNGAL